MGAGRQFEFHVSSGSAVKVEHTGRKWNLGAAAIRQNSYRRQAKADDAFSQMQIRSRVAIRTSLYG
jgi:hypothetical protein